MQTKVSHFHGLLYLDFLIKRTLGRKIWICQVQSVKYYESSWTLARSGSAFPFGSALLSKVLWSFPNEACWLCELAISVLGKCLTLHECCWLQWSHLQHGHLDIEAGVPHSRAEQPWALCEGTEERVAGNPDAQSHKQKKKRIQMNQELYLCQCKARGALVAWFVELTARFLLWYIPYILIIKGAVKRCVKKPVCPH